MRFVLATSLCAILLAACASAAPPTPRDGDGDGDGEGKNGSPLASGSAAAPAPPAPAAPAPAYAPCDGKKTGDACTLCDPTDSACVETMVLKACDASGSCL